MSLLSNELSIDEVKVANYKDQGQTFVIQEGSTHKESWEVLATKAFKKGDLVFVSHRLSVRKRSFNYYMNFISLVL